MTMSIFDFIKADKYHVTIFLEYNESGEPRYDTEESIMVGIDDGFYEVELADVYLCNNTTKLSELVEIRRELREIVDDWNSEEYWKVLNVKTQKIE